MNYEVSSLGDMNGHYSQPHVHVSTISQLILSDGSFPSIDEFPYLHALISALLKAQEGCVADHQRSLCLSLSSPTSAYGLQVLCSYQALDSVSSTQGICWALPQFLLPAL